MSLIELCGGNFGRHEVEVIINISLMSKPHRVSFISASLYSKSDDFIAL